MRWERQLKSAASLDWILTLVQKSDGRASLAAFQILLWTLVVAVGAMFVMALSGNLINLTPGTLTLLGIAGATGLLAAFNDQSTTSVKQAVAPAGVAPAGVAAAVVAPEVVAPAVVSPAVVAPAQVAPAVVAPAPVAPAAVVPVPTVRVAPQWRDLIIDPVTGTPDIGRSQMLLFTVVSAAFVVVQVLNYYVIPDIPAGYQILIGISNGVYVGRKYTTNT
jgi:hypothetical protein